MPPPPLPQVLVRDITLADIEACFTLVSDSKPRWLRGAAAAGQLRQLLAPRTGASRPPPPVTRALNPAAAAPSAAPQPTEKACVKLGVGKLREEPQRGVCRSAPVPPRRVPPCACPQPPTSPPCPQASQSSSACAASTASSGGPTAPCSRWVLRGRCWPRRSLYCRVWGAGQGGARAAAELACPHPGGCAAEQLGAPEACTHPGASQTCCLHLAACCRRRARRSGTLRRPRRAPAATPSSAPPPALQPAPSPSSRCVLLSLAAAAVCGRLGAGGWAADGCVSVLTAPPRPDGTWHHRRTLLLHQLPRRPPQPRPIPAMAASCLQTVLAAAPWRQQQPPPSSSGHRLRWPPCQRQRWRHRRLLRPPCRWFQS